MAAVTSLILTAVGTVVIFKLIMWIVRYRRWAAQYDLVPGTHGHWFLGHLPEMPGANQEGFDYMYSHVAPYPKMYKVWVGWVQCSTVLHHPDTVRPVLKCSAKVAIKPRARGTVYRYGLPWLGEGLLLTNGERWARDRKLLTPGFHFDVLQPYVSVFNETVKVFLEKLARFSGSGETFDLYEHVGLLSLDNMMRCALSYSTDCQLREKHPYVVAVKRMADLWCDRSLHFLQMSDWIYFNLTSNGKEFLKLCDYVHQVAEDIIKKRRQELDTKEAGAGQRKDEDGRDKSHFLDFLDILLTAKDDEGYGLSDEEIRAEVDTFLFEGHDTISSGISFTLMSLAQNPDLQQRVQAEIDSVMATSQGDQVLWSDLPKLEYLTMCIKEGMRLNPPIFYIQRCLEEDMVIDGVTLQKGAPVIIHIRNLHHNPAVWGEDHWEFKPDRFLPENVETRDPFAYAPFSGGQRNCIGQHFAMNEMKVIIARVLHRYTLEIDPTFVDRKSMSVVTRPERGIQMKARKR